VEATNPTRRYLTWMIVSWVLMAGMRKRGVKNNRKRIRRKMILSRDDFKKWTVWVLIL